MSYYHHKTGFKSMTESQCFAYEVWVSSVPEFRHIVNARTSGKAKADYLMDLNESWPNYEYTDLRCRKIGECHTSDSFVRNAIYRGLPDVRCGQRVSVGCGRGVIIGHNSSANFDVLFDDDSPVYAGLKLNVHPSEVALLT